MPPKAYARRVRARGQLPPSRAGSADAPEAIVRHLGLGHRGVGDGLVDEHLAVPNLEVEGATGIGADPRLVHDGRALAPEVREGDEIALAALAADGESLRFRIGHHFASPHHCHATPTPLSATVSSRAALCWDYFPADVSKSRTRRKTRVGTRTGGRIRPRRARSGS